MSPEDLSVGDWEYEDKVAACVRVRDNVRRALVNMATVEQKMNFFFFLRNRFHFLYVCAHLIL